MQILAVVKQPTIYMCKTATNRIKFIMSFKDKVLLITGGSSGIGAATAKLFAKHGANVAIVGRNEKKLNKVAEEIAMVSDIPVVIKADVSKEENCKLIVKKTIDAFGKIDVLVNNVGIIRMGGLLDGNFLENYDQIMNTNIRPAVIITKESAPHLIKTKGNIVNISSVLGVSLLHTSSFLAYCISKAGVDHFTRSTALELGSHGVRVNAVSPGMTRTDLMQNADYHINWDDYKSDTVLNKVAEPDEIGELIMYIASDKGKSITGSNFYLENGELLK